MSYKLSFDLIEETMKNKDEKSDKKPKQYILINAKPFANKNNYNSELKINSIINIDIPHNRTPHKRIMV